VPTIDSPPCMLYWPISANGILMSGQWARDLPCQLQQGYWDGRGADHGCMLYAGRVKGKQGIQRKVDSWDDIIMAASCCVTFIDGGG
jgi:hypothetical protein